MLNPIDTKHFTSNTPVVYIGNDNKFHTGIAIAYNKYNERIGIRIDENSKRVVFIDATNVYTNDEKENDTTMNTNELKVTIAELIDSGHSTAELHKIIHEASNEVIEKKKAAELEKQAAAEKQKKINSTRAELFTALANYFEAIDGNKLTTEEISKISAEMIPFFEALEQGKSLFSSFDWLF